MAKNTTFFCNECGFESSKWLGKCPSCGETADVEWYDRITGYVQQVGHAKSANGGWNAGKRQVLIDRRRFEQ